MHGTLRKPPRRVDFSSPRGRLSLFEMEVDAPRLACGAQSIAETRRPPRRCGIRRVALMELDVAATYRNPLGPIQNFERCRIVQYDPELVLFSRLWLRVVHPDAIGDRSTFVGACIPADLPGACVLMRRRRRTGAGRRPGYSVGRDTHVIHDLRVVHVQATPVVEVVSVAPKLLILHATMPPEVRSATRDAAPRKERNPHVESRVTALNDVPPATRDEIVGRNPRASGGDGNQHQPSNQEGDCKFPYDVLHDRLLRRYGRTAVADPATTFTSPSSVVTCSALTVIPFAAVVTSFRTTWMVPITSVWFCSPVATIGTPLTTKPSISDQPTSPPYESAVAVAIVKSAEIVPTAVVSTRSPRDAADDTKSPSPIAVASNVAAVPMGMLPVSSDASIASQLFARGPVDATRAVAPVPVAMLVPPTVKPPILVTCAPTGPGTARNAVSPMTSAATPNRRYLVLLMTCLLS